MDTERFRTILVAERRRVASTIEEETYDDHLADSASATLNRGIDSTLEENSEHLLSGIEEALGRIENGTFGMCSGCGKQIAEERLEAIPYATRCIDCQRLAERA